MFDTIAGLPLHPLIVHAVVVLLPLMAVVTGCVAVRSSWRHAAPWVVLADAVVVGCSFVAKQSGQALQHRLTAIRGGAAVAVAHGQEGSLVPLFALALFAAAVVVWAARRRPALTGVSIALAVVTGLASIGWIVVVGHSGATDVWGGLVTSSAASH